MDEFIWLSSPYESVRPKLENVERIKAHIKFYDLFLILPHFSCKLVLPVVQVIDTFQIGEL